jgi:hypothetical protein
MIPQVTARVVLTLTPTDSAAMGSIAAARMPAPNFVLFRKKWIANMDIWHFCKSVFARIILPCAAISIACYVSTRCIHIPGRIILTFALSFVVGVIAIWMSALDMSEKSYIKQLIDKKRK